MKQACTFLTLALLSLILTVNEASGATFTNLYVFSADDFNSQFLFTNRDGVGPNGLVISGNVIYGTAASGGQNSYGTVFRMNTDGSHFTNLFNFDRGPYDSGTGTYPQNTGMFPGAGLVLVGDTLYGTTHTGGKVLAGSIFRINTDGSGFATIHEFNYVDGQGPQHGLTLHSNLLYGTTVLGGSNGWGNVFTIDLTNNNISFVYQFTNEVAPYGGLAFSGNGLYGFGRGSSGSNGWIYTLNGGYSILYNFIGTNGSDPWGTPIISGNTLFGTTTSGGQFMSGNVFRIDLNGSNYTNLYSFTPNGAANTDGSLTYNYTGLVLSGNKLYGTASAGGSGSRGTVFQLNTDGSGFGVLHSFNYADGADPESLVLSGGKLYGGTYGGFHGFANGSGGIFAITVQPSLNINATNNSAVVTWNDPTFSLYTSTNVSTTFTNIPGAHSPYTNIITGQRRFFRLQSN